MYNEIMMVGLYSLGIFIGFVLVPFVIRKPIVDEQEGIELDQTYDQLFLAYKFVDDVDEAPDSCLTEEELEGLRDKVLHYEIPYIKQKVILFYDHKNGGFSYYANSGIIYKYLNVAARRYVLDYGCKQVFKEMVPSLKKEEKSVKFGPFISKAGKTLLEKEMNHYHYLGTFQDFETKPVEHKKIDFAEYMKMLDNPKTEPSREAIFEPDPLPVQEPVTETKSSRVLEFLRQFSSNPKTQSTKTD